MFEKKGKELSKKKGSAGYKIKSRVKDNNSPRKKKFIDKELLKTLESEGYNRKLPEIKPFDIFKIRKKHAKKAKKARFKLSDIKQGLSKIENVSIPEKKTEEKKTKKGFFSRLSGLFSKKEKRTAVIPQETLKVETEIKTAIEEKPEDRNKEADKIKVPVDENIEPVNKKESPPELEKIELNPPLEVKIEEEKPKKGFFARLREKTTKKKGGIEELDSVKIISPKNDMRHMDITSSSGNKTSPYSKKDDNVTKMLKDQIIPEKLSYNNEQDDKNDSENKNQSSETPSSMNILFSEKKKKLFEGKEK